MADFARNLFRGTARYYDRYRVPYPDSLIRHLSKRAVVSPPGTLLDIACGTGQLTFALHARFARTWAVDQEPDMIEVVREKAAAAGADDIVPLVASVEDLAAPEASFDLIVAGNAFHRFGRSVAAANFFRWLRPGGYAGLMWSDSPWTGDAPWQEALRDVMDRWRQPGRIPPGYAADRAAHPDQEILAAAGFEPAGSRELVTDVTWTADAITGFMLSTAVLSRLALGDGVAGFEAELRRELLARSPDGGFVQRFSSACDLYRRPSV